MSFKATSRFPLTFQQNTALTYPNLFNRFNFTGAMQLCLTLNLVYLYLGYKTLSYMLMESSAGCSFCICVQKRTEGIPLQ